MPPPTRRQGVEAKLQVVGERPDQRLIFRPLAARHPGQRQQQVALLPPRRRLAEHMEAVSDLRFLQVAEEGVDLFERRRLVLGQRHVAVEPRSRA